MLTQIKALNWESNQVVNFATAPETTSVRKTLQVDYKVVGCVENLHFLGCYLMVLALTTVPLIVAFQKFLLRKVLKTVLKCNLVRFHRYICFHPRAHIILQNFRILNQIKVRHWVIWPPCYHQREGWSLSLLNL